MIKNGISWCKGFGTASLIFYALAATLGVYVEVGEKKKQENLKKYYKEELDKVLDKIQKETTEN